MIPILLVTGFLGAGKTTLINWLLEKHSERKISVVLNEFGDTKLESQFVKFHTENIVELANGCMCCVAKSDIPRVVSYILEHSPQTEYILIEASGLSDPDPVREALQSPPVSNATYLESIVCIVDAINFEQNRVEHSIVNSQVADADLVILAKIDKAGKQASARVQSLLESLTPDVRVLPFTASLEPKIFLTDTMPSAKVEHIHTHEHEQYQIYSYHTNHPLQLDKVWQCISDLPKNIVRIKGVIQCLREGKSMQVRIQRVGSHVTSDEILGSTGAKSGSTILCIGQDFDEKQISQALDGCRVKLRS